MDSRKRDNLLLLATIALWMLPFLGKPFHIDDPYFIEIARNILKNPADPFSGAVTLLDQDYRVFEAAHRQPNTFETMSHPPLVPYFIALVSVLAGGISEPSLHLAFLLFPVIASLSIYSLARRFTEVPLAASLLLVASPLFLVNAQNLMTDVPMLALFLASLALFVSGSDSSLTGRLLSAGFLAGLAILTRYVALLLIPVFFLYAVVENKSLRSVWLSLIPTLLLLAAWSAQNIWYYGQIHLFAGALHYLRFYGNASFSLQAAAQKAVSDLAGIGGAAFPVLAFSFALFPQKKATSILIASLAAAAAATWLNPFSIESLPGYSPWEKAGLMLFLAAGLFASLQALFSTQPQSPADDRFLRVWFVIALLCSILMLPFGTGRYMLPVLPPAALLLARQAQKTRTPFVIGIFLTFCLSGLLCVGDFNLANGYKQAAESVLKRQGQSKIWFVCDWGFRYYMERGGGTYLASEDSSPEGADIIVQGEMCSLHSIAEPLKSRLRPVEEFEIRSWFPVRILNVPAHAGFYSDGYGLLPYSFSYSPLDRFRIYKVSP